MKKCTNCKVEKEFTEFHRHKNTRDGYQFHCKECRRTYYNKSDIRKRAIQRARESQQRNKEHRQEYLKQWKIDNVERWRELKRHDAHVRRVRKLNALGEHSIEEWEALKAFYYHRCVSCGIHETGINDFIGSLTRDHIVPLSRGGSNWIWNIQPLCNHCNSVKFTKTINYLKEVLCQTEQESKSV